jgi:NarL family two-component system sensor histidine kinase LiaS
VEEELNISSIAEVQLVCILQEALANVRKHAHASQVSVSIKKLNQNQSINIQFQIIDNGSGFTLKNSKHSFGVKTMKERAKSVQGSLEVQSIMGKGTTVECLLPCIDTHQMKKGQDLFTREGRISVP